MGGCFAKCCDEGEMLAGGRGDWSDTMLRLINRRRRRRYARSFTHSSLRKDAPTYLIIAFDQHLVILGQGNEKHNRGNVLETMNPLPSF